MEYMEECRICPRNCAVNRCGGKVGFCGETDQIRIARAALHFWEEPFISGEKGSGAIFFSGCNLKCIYCQNAEIALSAKGKAFSVGELAGIMLDLQEQGAHNINLVTASHVVIQVREALISARKKGLHIPVVYNSSAYESVETIRLLEGLVDIYLPDYKYMDATLAANYSHAPDYPHVAAMAIAEMFRQTGAPLYDEAGMLLRGVVVRHLVLPFGVRNAKAVLDYLRETYGKMILISVMNQFTPVRKTDAYPHLNRRVTKREYENVLSYVIEHGMENVYFQEGETAKESFIPEFDL